MLVPSPDEFENLHAAAGVHALDEPEITLNDTRFAPGLAQHMTAFRLHNVSMLSALAAFLISAPKMIIFRPEPLPISAQELVNPGRGFFEWEKTGAVPIPSRAQDQYMRFNWLELEPAPGLFDFNVIEVQLERARKQRAKFGFRIMVVESSTGTYAVPEHWKGMVPGTLVSYETEMAKRSEANMLWVPKWDSPEFLEKVRLLMIALAKKFDGDPRLGYYGIGIYGHGGEWHCNKFEELAADKATKRKLVDLQVDAFRKTRLLMNSGGSEVDAFTYALNKSPKIGIWVNSLGNPWFAEQFEQFPAKNALISTRWRSAPIVAEWFGGNDDYKLAAKHVAKLKVAKVANSNNLDWAIRSSEQRRDLLRIGKISGYRLELKELKMPFMLRRGKDLKVTTTWRNSGVAPLYEKFQTDLEFVNLKTQKAAWIWRSGYDLSRLMPSTRPSVVTDQFQVPKGIKPGDYAVRLSVKDPTGYRYPISLAIVAKKVQSRYPVGIVRVK